MTRWRFLYNAPHSRCQESHDTPESRRKTWKRLEKDTLFEDVFVHPGLIPIMQYFYHNSIVLDWGTEYRIQLGLATLFEVMLALI
jgi:hypothetical protein